MELRECNRERKEKEKERGVSESILSSFFPLPKLLPPSSLFLRLSDARAFCLACSAPRGSRFCCSGTSRSHCRRRRSGPEAELHADSSFDVDVAAAACCRVPLPATPLRPCLCFLLLFLFLPGAGAAAVSSSRPPQPGRLRRRQQRRGRPRVRGPQSPAAVLVRHASECFFRSVNSMAATISSNELFFFFFFSTSTPLFLSPFISSSSSFPRTKKKTHTKGALRLRHAMPRGDLPLPLPPRRAPLRAQINSLARMPHLGRHSPF